MRSAISLTHLNNPPNTHQSVQSFFSQPKVLDGGMGQALLKKGLESYGTLWSASALMNPEGNKLVVDAHKEFIAAGSKVIVTNTFGARRKRLEENDVAHLFEELNHRAGELAGQARKEENDDSVMIAGGLPPQVDTYQAIDGKENPDVVEKNFHDQAATLVGQVDFFYLDVLSSALECQLALQAIKEFNLPVLIGLHVRPTGKLPSGESVSEVMEKLEAQNLTQSLMGVTTSCVTPETVEMVITEMQSLGTPFGFKVNGFKAIPDDWKLTAGASQPTETLGQREDFTPAKFEEFVTEMEKKGATILGGCCEIFPEHIKAISNFSVSK